MLLIWLHLQYWLTNRNQYRPKLCFQELISGHPKTHLSTTRIWFLIPTPMYDQQSLGRGSICLSVQLLLPVSLLHSSPSVYLSFTFALFSHFSLSPFLLSSPSSSAAILPLSLSISIVTFISLTLCLFYFSLKEYIQDADKCDGPLAGSPLQLRRLFSYCINPPGLFPFAFLSSCSWRMWIHRATVTIHWGSERFSDSCGPVGSTLMTGKRLRPSQPWCQIYSLETGWFKGKLATGEGNSIFEAQTSMSWTATRWVLLRF